LKKKNTENLVITSKVVRTHSLHPCNNAPPLKPWPAPLEQRPDIETIASTLANVYGSTPMKDFEGTDEKLFSPA
jgi:hypothetical protein